MRIINTDLVRDAVKSAFLLANRQLPADVYDAIKTARRCECNKLASDILDKTLENADIAREENMPICQDTGLPIVFIDVGTDVHFEGVSLTQAINDGAAQAYAEGNFRASVVADPLFGRKNTGTGGPAIIHTTLTDGDEVIISALPKGFGAENMSRLKMFTPAASVDDIIDFVVQTAKIAGGNPCPPTVLGVGIGGDFESCALMAKKALAIPLDSPNPNPDYAGLECKMLAIVNATGVGPQGFGGDTSCLGVKILYAPTHIAGLPVAVNVSCHATRHYTIKL